MKKLGFGCMRLPSTDPNDEAGVDMPLFGKGILPIHPKEKEDGKIRKIGFSETSENFV